MSFLASTFLLALPLVGVPILVHLLNRRRRDVVRWGAMQFLEEAVAHRRRIWRIEDLLLMLLRAVAVLAFILAMAQPLLRSNWFGAAGPRDVVLVLDTSMSTSQTNSATSLFDKELKQADRLIDGLRDGDYLRVLLASSVPEWLVPAGIPVSSDMKRELRARLEQIEPTLASADMMRCVQEALDARPADESAMRIVSILTDGEAHGWRAEAAQMWRGLKEKMTQGPVAVVVNVVCVGQRDATPGNLSVASVTTMRTLVGVGEPVPVAAQIENAGHREMPAGLASWTCGDEPVGVTPVPPLAPGEQTTLTIKHAFDAPGVYEITCRIDASDDLAMDNTGRLVVEVTDSVPILVVDGSPWARPLEKEAGYLLVALGYDIAESGGEWKSVFKPDVTDVSGLPAKRLSDYRCVVLADVATLPEDLVGQLTGYVQSGGGVWIILGPDTAPSGFNQRLFTEGRGLSPLALAEPAGEPDDEEHAVAITPPAAQHPATVLLADTERLDIDQTRVRRRHRFVYGEKDKGVSVLLTTADGEPLVVEKTIGRGRVIVQGLPMSPRWSNLPGRLAFVVMIHEWLWYLAEPSTTHWNVDLGEALTARLPLETASERAEIVTPDGHAAPVTIEDRQTQRVYACPQTRLPGPYQLIVENGSAQRLALPFCVRRDAAESKLSPLREADADALRLAGGLQFGDDPLALSTTDSTAARAESLWTWLLVAMLAMFLAESGLAGRMTRRRLAPVTAVQMQE